MRARKLPPFRQPRAYEQSPQNAETVFCRSVDVHLFFSRGLQCQLCHGSSLSSRSIGQPLADHAAQKVVGALGIIYAKGDAIAEAEVKLGYIALQVLLADAVIGADQSALEKPNARV